MNTATLIGNSFVGLKRNSGGSSLREDGNELLPVLEMSAFFDIDHIETALALATLILDDLLASYPIGFLDLALQMQKKSDKGSPSVVRTKAFQTSNEAMQTKQLTIFRPVSSATFEGPPSSFNRRSRGLGGSLSSWTASYHRLICSTANRYCLRLK